MRSSRVGASLPAQCFQRLSLPHLATVRCHWHDKRCTVASIPFNNCSVCGTARSGARCKSLFGGSTSGRPTRFQTHTTVSCGVGRRSPRQHSRRGPGDAVRNSRCLNDLPTLCVDDRIADPTLLRQQEVDLQTVKERRCPRKRRGPAEKVMNCCLSRTLGRDR